MSRDTRYRRSQCWADGLTLLVVFGLLLSVAPTAVAASGASGAAGTQPAVGSDSPAISGSSLYQQGADGNFTVSRTGPDTVTVELNATVVGDRIQEGNVSITVNGDEPEWIGTWNLTDTGSSGGTYTTTFDPPTAAEYQGGSLVNATVSLSNADVSDRAHLHSVETSGTPVWTNNSKLYVPVDGTVGVTESDADAIGLSFSNGDAFGGQFQYEQNLFVINTSDISVRSPAEDLTVNVTTDGDLIATDRTLDAEIRYLHGDIVLWHPYIQQGTEYDVTVHGVDGEQVDSTSTAAAGRTGSVSVPAPDTVAAGDSVNLSLSGGGTALNESEIAGTTDPPNTTAVRVGSNTVQFGHSLTGLSVSSVVLQQDGGPVYVSGSDITTEDRQLRLSNATVTENTTLEMATDAGIVQVELQGSQSGGQSSNDDGPGLLGLIIPLTIGLALSVGGGGLGFFAGGRFNAPSDIIDALLVLLIITSTLALVFLVGFIFLDFVKSSPILVAGGLLLPLVMGIGGFAVGNRRSGGSSGAAAATNTVSVSVTNGTSRINGQSRIKATRQSDRKTETVTATGGEAHLQLPKGTWAIRATHGGHSSTQERIEVGPLSGGGAVTLPIELPDVSIQVEDPTFGPIHNASVRMDTDGDSTAKRTGQNGEAVTFEPPADADSVSITVTHDRYHDTVEEYRLSGGGVEETITLEPKKGTLHLVSQIDGTPVGGLECDLAPNDEYLEQLYNSGTRVTTEANGEWEEAILVGRYRATLQLPPDLGDLFETSAKTFVVSQGGSNEVRLEASFTWDLSDQQRSRIQRIRTDLADITAKSGIDTAIPQYYVSVIEMVLDAVEQFPSQGQYFAEVDVHPDAVTDATLDAAADATQTIAEAMSSKRNRDLFTACSDMADATVRWDGTFDLATLVDRLNQDSMDLRRTFAQEADNVSDRIDAERGSLSEIAPAREMLEYVELPESGDQVDRIVATHVAILLLSAIDDLFDHPPLRDRLSRTVF